MKCKILSHVLMIFLLAIFFSPQDVKGEERKLFIPDKALCTKMLRFGKQAYERGQYLDAKVYFRKAVQADPTSNKAWQHYDMATIFALAEKVEKNASLIAPDTSTRQTPVPGKTKVSPPAPRPPTAPAKKAGVDDEEEEGC